MKKSNFKVIPYKTEAFDADPYKLDLEFLEKELKKQRKARIIKKFRSILGFIFAPLIFLYSNAVKFFTKKSVVVNNKAIAPKVYTDKEKLRRCYGIAFDMTSKGMLPLDKCSLDRQVDLMIEFSDDALDAFERAIKGA